MKRMKQNIETKPRNVTLEVEGGLFSKYDLSRFKVFSSSSLFPPNFELLQQNKCPICGRKLYWNMKKDKAFCKSKIGDKFFITRNTMSRLGLT